MKRIRMSARPGKIHAFNGSTAYSGIDPRSVSYGYSKPLSRYRNPSLAHLKKIASSFILFDWEFFSNELEYE
ncbi:MAG: hypothetical protein Q8L07_07135 [Sediminibacterium sp.]|nr:hypothetical protein [Sediminibacterium sp.]MDP1811395.1 hypothetical protein [Sediminibacterium sp.]MDP3127153.1 hypothetical protein [Sediminibacterium sp.]MDP3667230.1 hypothetical protein [Sediminibacterium sp.]